MTNVEWEDKIIRDPIHGYIGLTEEEKKIIDTPVMQRLRRIKQLATTYLTYPGAVHTRFEHSLGTMYIADKIAQRLKLDDKRKIIIRFAALLHDVGHGPFSHVSEDILKYVNNGRCSHEEITCDIIRNDESIKEILGDDLKAVIELIEKKKERTVESDIISSQLDADKIDYLTRDSIYAGVMYGRFDISRVIYTMKIQKEKNKKASYLAISEKGMDAVEEFVLSRYYMFTQVYKHHTRMITDAMVTRAIELAFEEKVLRKKDFQYPSNSTKFLENYLRYDDYTLVQKIISESKGNSMKLLKGILERKLLKCRYEKSLNEIDIPDYKIRDKINKMTPDNIRKMERSIANDLGVDEDVVIVNRDVIKNPTYSHPGTTIQPDVILIQYKDETTRALSEISPILRGGEVPYVQKIYVYSPVNEKRRVDKAVEGYLDTI